VIKHNNRYVLVFCIVAFPALSAMTHEAYQNSWNKLVCNQNKLQVLFGHQVFNQEVQSNSAMEVDIIPLAYKQSKRKRPGIALINSPLLAARDFDEVELISKKKSQKSA
jgi:hypothetical protein